VISSGLIYISPDDITARVEDNGFKCIVLGEDIELDKQLQQCRKNSNFFSRWWKCRQLIQQQRKRMLMGTELTTIVSELNPDRVLVDIELHYVIIVCSALGLNCLLISAWFSIFKDAENLPPLHTYLTPPQTQAEQQTVKSVWESEFKARERRRIRHSVKHFFKRYIAPRSLSYQSLNTIDLEQVANSVGFDFHNKTDFAAWLRPMTFKHLPILVFNILEMDYPHQADPRAHYVGPMINKDRKDPHLRQGDSSEWTRLRRLYETDQQTKSLIYCSLGTFWKTDKAFLHLIIETVKKRPEWQLIIGLGDKSRAADFDISPQNVMLLDWAPQLEILPWAKVAITHGGISTINECVLHQVPMLVYSTEHGDQNGCAARVAWHGLGIIGNKAEDDCQQIEKHLQSLIKDHHIHSNLAEMRSLFINYQNQQRAEKLIEQDWKEPRLVRP